MQMVENPKVVCERLGHVRAGITIDIYSHSIEEIQKQQPVDSIRTLDLIKKLVKYFVQSCAIINISFLKMK
ncbi:hypothetical protein [Bacillus sp. EAC]|uniref:hypothetical protein n=1 Tax=Bacillus sp. EAC TaxID=1978338 RepID=UPI001C4E8D38|nr:hypothetical protein [Bacillus sp. EAC]